MLQTTAVLSGLVAVAQAAALQSVPAAALFGRASSPVNCGAYPSHNGPSQNTQWVASNGKPFIVDCYAEKGSYGWQYTSGSFPTFESCAEVCAAGQFVPGCSYVAWQKDSYYCAMNSQPLEDAQDYFQPYDVISAQLVKTLNCHDGSSNGTVFTPPGSTQKYQILCNYQYGGNTIGSKQADTFETCVGLCESTSGCVDVVYSDAKYCWLKSSKTNGYASPNWYSAVKVPADFNPGSPAPAAQGGYNSNPGAIHCYDNSADGTVFTAPSGNKYNIKCNYQYDGDTISNKYTNTFEECADLCDTTAGCVDGIWDSAKYCWLKSSMTGAGYQSPGWYSAVKVQGN